MLSDVLVASILVLSDATSTSLNTKVDAIHASLDAKIDTKIDTFRAEMNTSFAEMRKDVTAMRESIASLGGMQKAILWLFGMIITLIAAGVPVAKALHWI